METADFTASGIYNWRRGLDDFISCSGPINLILVSLYEISHPTVGIIFDSFKLSIGLLIFKVWKKSKWCLLTFEKVADFKWTDPYIHHWSFLSHVHCLMFIVSCSMFHVPCSMFHAQLLNIKEAAALGPLALYTRHSLVGGKVPKCIN